MSLLNEIQLRTLKAAVDRVVPQDGFPSASEAGCVEFLLKLMLLELQVEFYRDGLDALEAASMVVGRSFSTLTDEDQDRLLHRLEEGDEPRLKRFIEVLARQTIEGYYSDPENGGNRASVSWKMIGFEVNG